MSKMLDKIRVKRIASKARKNNLGISDQFINETYFLSNYHSESDLKSHKIDLLFLDDVINASSKEHLISIIKSNYYKYCVDHSMINSNIVLYPVLGEINKQSDNFVSENVARNILYNNHDFNSIDYIGRNYTKALYNYISSNIHIRKEFILSTNHNYENDGKFSKQYLSNLFELINKHDFNSLSYIEKKNIDTLLSKVLTPLLSVYHDQDLKNNQELVEFEVINGFMDKYFNRINNGNTLPSLEERIEDYDKQKEFSKRQIETYDEVKFLFNNIVSLKNNEIKEKLFSVLMRAYKDENLEKIEKVRDLYEKSYKEEIVNSLYSPSDNIVELNNYEDLKNVLVQPIYKDSKMLLKEYKEKVFYEIIYSREDKSLSPELTEIEQKILDGKMKKASELLLNTSNLDELLDMNIEYSKADNLLITTLYSPKSMVSYSYFPKIGVGYDCKGIPGENIVISSKNELTTNNKVENIDSKRSSLKYSSTPLVELENQSFNKVVMFKNGENYSTNPSYIFFSVDGFDEKTDRENFEQAKKLASENNLPLVIFNIPELKKSHYNKKENKYKKNKIIY